jgi:hypothetical protein
LARKGAAKPAMRPQGFGQVGAGLEDLGWNDMGFEPPKPTSTPAPDAEHDAFGEVIPAHPHNLAGLTPVESPVHKQQAELTGRLSSYSPEDAGEEEEYDDTAEAYDAESEEVADEEELAESEFAEDEPLEEEVVEAQLAGPLVADTEAPRFDSPMAIKPVRAPALPSAAAAILPKVPAPSAPRRERKSRSAPGSKEKAAFTLRLDSDRHLKLRLACAINGRSAQMLVTEALDQLLAAMPEVEAMAEKARKKG